MLEYKLCYFVRGNKEFYRILERKAGSRWSIANEPDFDNEDDAFLRLQALSERK